MKIKLVAIAALAAFTGSAYAQSSVTLYGVIDGGLLYQNAVGTSFIPALSKNGGKVFAYKDGGIYASNWGMRGTEDIGGGYKINFRLQGTLNSGTGAFGLSGTSNGNAAFSQYATIGVSSPYGRIDVGRQIVPMIWAMYDTDARSSQYFGSILTAWVGLNQATGWIPVSTNGSIGALYDDNAIVYQSPTFGGVSFALEYAPGGVPGQFQGSTRESAVLKYANYGLHLSAVYYNGHDTNPYAVTPAGVVSVAPAGVDNNRFYYLGAMYTFRGFSVSASWANGRNPSNTAKANVDMYSAGLGYAFSPALNVTSGFYYLKDKNHSANHSAEISLAVDYNLSKQTTLYAEVGRVDNRGNNMGQTIVYGEPTAPNQSTTGAMIGIRHSF
jgi:predicted porin